MKFYKKKKRRGLRVVIKGKNKLHIENEKKKKKDLVATGFEPWTKGMGVQRNNHCTSELCVQN